MLFLHLFSWALRSLFPEGSGSLRGAWKSAFPTQRLEHGHTVALFSSDVAGALCPVCGRWSSFPGTSLCVGLSSSGEAGVSACLIGQSPKSECVPWPLWVTTFMVPVSHPVILSA